MKLRRGKASPKKEAADFTATGKDRDGFDVKYISSDKVRFIKNIENEYTKPVLGNEAGTVPEVTTSPRVVTDKSETVVPTEDTEKNEAGTVPEVTTSPRVITDKSETVVPTEDTEKIAVVKEQSGSEGQETIGPSEKTAKSALVLLLRSAQACHFSRLEILTPVLEVNLRMGVK
ncbi:hypothetical protein QTP86_019464, partial [Hemibagrus guttatus]